MEGFRPHLFYCHHRWFSFRECLRLRWLRSTLSCRTVTGMGNWTLGNGWATCERRIIISREIKPQDRWGTFEKETTCHLALLENHSKSLTSYYRAKDDFPTLCFEWIFLLLPKSGREWKINSLTLLISESFASRLSSRRAMVTKTGGCPGRNSPNWWIKITFHPTNVRLLLLSPSCIPNSNAFSVLTLHFVAYINLIKMATANSKPAQNLGNGLLTNEKSIFKVWSFSS